MHLKPQICLLIKPIDRRSFCDVRIEHSAKLDNVIPTEILTLELAIFHQRGQLNIGLNDGTYLQFFSLAYFRFKIMIILLVPYMVLLVQS